MATLKLNKKKYDFLVFIGRFQPAHNAHIEIIDEALERADNVIVCIGSAYQPRTPKDPFTAREREDMIASAVCETEVHRLFFQYIADKKYNDQQWALDIQDSVMEVIRDAGVKDPSVGIIGHQKDHSTFYLDMFPQWDFVPIDNIEDLHATSIRDYYFNSKWESDPFDTDPTDVFVEMCEDYLNANIFQYLLGFRETDEYRFLKEEFTFIEKYKSAWDHSPYAPTFVTCDGVVIQSGHILLVQRRAAPGAGLWALPGGFVDQKETIENAVLRELREETKLKVPTPVLKGSIKDQKVFDYPMRSLRGRTITHAYLIELNPGPLPPVKGGDDAAKAKWFPISEVMDMSEKLFEDHADIINYFIGRV
jgi:bifunctional NMN adenylyltransferase/nudix hydrolase